MVQVVKIFEMIFALPYKSLALTVLSSLFCSHAPSLASETSHSLFYPPNNRPDQQRREQRPTFELLVWSGQGERAIYRAMQKILSKVATTHTRVQMELR